MSDVTKSILPALVIPLLLIISVAVYMSTTDSTSFAFEEAVVNESTGLTGDGSEQTVLSTYPCKEDSVTSAYNGTDTIMTAVTDYNVTYHPLASCNLTVGEHIEGGAIVMSYTAYKGDGYTAFDKMNDQTYSGFKLASTLPYVVLAMVVLGIVVGTFVLV